MSRPFGREYREEEEEEEDDDDDDDDEEDDEEDEEVVRDRRLPPPPVMADEDDEDDEDDEEEDEEVRAPPRPPPPPPPPRPSDAQGERRKVAKRDRYRDEEDDELREEKETGGKRRKRGDNIEARAERLVRRSLDEAQAAASLRQEAHTSRERPVDRPPASLLETDILRALRVGRVDTLSRLVLFHRAAPALARPLRDGLVNLYPVHVAAREGSVDCVWYILTLHPTQSTQSDERGFTLLHYAAAYNRNAVLTWMIQAGISGFRPLDITDPSKHDPQGLIRVQVDVDVVDSKQDTPLAIAIQGGHVEAMVCLARARARLPMVIRAPIGNDAAGFPPAYYLAQSQKFRALDALLGAFPDAINQRGVAGGTILHCMVRNATLRDIEALFNRHPAFSALIGERDAMGDTPLHIAVWRGGDVACLRFLLDQIRDRRLQIRIDTQNADGRTPLDDAAQHGSQAAVELLIERGASLGGGRSTGRWTPLHAAVAGEQEHVVKLLLGLHGVDVNAQDRDGSTPLLLAARHGSVRVRDLLRAGARVDIPNSDGDLPIHAAAKEGLVGVLDTLAEEHKVRGISLSQRNRARCTPLICAVYSGNMSSVRSLLRVLEHPDEDDLYPSALAMAARFEKASIAMELLRRGARMDIIRNPKDLEYVRRLIVEDTAQRAREAAGGGGGGPAPSRSEASPETELRAQILRLFLGAAERREERSGGASLPAGAATAVAAAAVRGAAAAASPEEGVEAARRATVVGMSAAMECVLRYMPREQQQQQQQRSQSQRRRGAVSKDDLADETPDEGDDDDDQD